MTNCKCPCLKCELASKRVGVHCGSDDCQPTSTAAQPGQVYRVTSRRFGTATVLVQAVCGSLATCRILSGSLAGVGPKSIKGPKGDKPCDLEIEQWERTLMPEGKA